MMRSAVLPALALLFATGASSAQTTLAVTLPCVPAGDAETLVQALLPETIQSLGQICANRLPPTALIRQNDGAFIAKYRAEADAAWARAEGTIARLAGPDVQPLLGSSMARPLIASIVTPALTRQVQPADCPSIERIAGVIAPLPARSTASLFVSVLQLVDARRTVQPNKPVIRICTQGAAA